MHTRFVCAILAQARLGYEPLLLLFPPARSSHFELVVFAPPPVGGLGLRGTRAVGGLGLRGTWAASRGGEARGRLAPPGAGCSRGPCCRAAPLPRWLGVRSASVCSPRSAAGDEADL